MANFETVTVETDLLLAGGGMACCGAAVEASYWAKKHGLKVTLVDKAAMERSGAVAMGLSGSDIATNSAGIALMTDDVGRIPFLVELARKTRVIITQNIVGSCPEVFERQCEWIAAHRESHRICFVAQPGLCKR